MGLSDGERPDWPGLLVVGGQSEVLRRSPMMVKAEEEEGPVRARARSRRGCLIFGFACLIAWAACYRVSHPPDWVDVTVGLFPGGTADFCLIAEGPGRAFPLPWYYSKLLIFTLNPVEAGQFQGGFYDHDSDAVIEASVKWEESSRYGVLIQLEDRRWLIYWLEPGDWRRRPSAWDLVLGGGKAKIRLPPGERAQVPSKELLESLGLSP
jgi:hypothetical protein